LRMAGFQIVGINRWDDPIPVDNAYVRSDIDNDRIDLTAQIRRGRLLDQLPVTVIPAGKEFTLAGSLARSGEAMTEDEFRKKFLRCTFIFNSKIVRRFYEKDIDDLLARAHVEVRKSLDR
jgi:hypothetical protein